jgi:hypothetical protein
MEEMKRFNLPMGVWLFLFGSFFLFSFVGAAGSSLETEFNIAGCTFQFDDELVGLSVGECSVGEEYGGWFFCNENMNGYITTEVGLGCSRGETTFTSGTPEGACCPSGYFCDEVSGEFQCKTSAQNCLSNMTESVCESLEVDGYYYNNECVCERSEQSCDIYTTKSACSGDVMNIGSVGIGRSEYCGGYLECGGTTFSIPQSSCGCSWNSDDSSCDHTIAAVEAFSTGTPSGFECSSSYNIGECVNGSRDINWTSAISESGDVPTECLDILGCSAGSDISFCGEDFVKLPGFSLFSLFMSLFLIGIYYFMLGVFKYKGSYKLQ